MIPPRKLGSALQSRDDVEDAEFVEIDETPINDAAITRPERSGLKTVLLAALGCLVLLFVVDIAVHSTGTETGEEYAPDSVEAQQMLARWTWNITGHLDDRGFTMVDGESVPGSTCRDPRSNQFLRFGGLKLAGTEGPLLHSAFRMGFADQDSVIEGAFWFDATLNKLTVRNAALVDREGEVVRALPDSEIPIQPRRDGLLEFRGTTFHVCKNEERE